MYPVAAVPKTPASTPAVFDNPNNTPCVRKQTFLEGHGMIIKSGKHD